MCQRITCNQCKKPSFAGCGRHVEQVLGDVKPEDRCACKGKVAEESPSGGLLGFLFGRR